MCFPWTVCHDFSVTLMDAAPLSAANSYPERSLSPETLPISYVRIP